MFSKRAAGPAALRGFETYRAVWAFNGSAYPLLTEVLPDESARRVLQGVGAALVLATWWRTRVRVVPGSAAARSSAPGETPDPTAATAPVESPGPSLAPSRAATLLMAATGGCVLLSPTVHPWYVLWALGAGLWVGGTTATVWTLAAVLVPFAYRVLSTLRGGVWHEEAVTRWVIWGPVWALLGREGWRWLRGRRARV